MLLASRRGVLGLGEGQDVRRGYFPADAKGIEYRIVAV